MDKYVIGLLFILAGTAYSSLALDGIYNKSLGWLVEHDWLKAPVAMDLEKSVFGRKPTIIFYGLSLIAVGVYILIKLD